MFITVLRLFTVHPYQTIKPFTIFNQNLLAKKKSRIFSQKATLYDEPVTTVNCVYKRQQATAKFSCFIFVLLSDARPTTTHSRRAGVSCK